MNKLYSLFIGILVTGIVMTSYNFHLNSQIAANKEVVRNYRSNERFWSHDTLELVMDENTLPILGSSELVSLSDYKTKTFSFLNSDDINIVTIGRGHFQSLSHAMILGSIADGIKSNKIALFISPQWFNEKGGISPDAFPERFGEEHLLFFLDNKDISRENKEYVLDRVLSLLSKSPTQYERVKKYKDSYENGLSLSNLYAGIMKTYWRLQSKYQVYRQFGQMDKEIPVIDLYDADFTEIMKLAEKQGEAACTNNDFGIYDDYWNTYVKSKYEQEEIAEKEQIYTDSLEYEDLRCFLRVANELNKEVLLVSIPVNAAWYSYQGNLCTEYYDNIRNIAKEYHNVKLIDMTSYENEKYFFKDIMHLGWKGWTRINEALYREFKK